MTVLLPGAPATTQATTQATAPAPTDVPRRSAATASAVLRAVLDHGPVARSTVGEVTGLSPAAVSRQLSTMTELGLVRDHRVPRLRSTVGRPHVPVDIDTGHQVIAGIHVAVPHATLVLMDLRGRVVAEERRRHAPGHTPGGLLAGLGDAMAHFLDRHAGGRRPLGVGFATGGHVDPGRGTVVTHPQLGWHELAVGAALEDRLGLPVRVESHARALARAEQLIGAHRERARTSQVALFVGNVVDAAIATNGSVHQGPGAAAGDVRHLPVGSETGCACGRAGCFEATVTEQAVAVRAVECGHLPVPRFADVLAALEAGAPWAERLFAERARAVGRVAALLLDLINPEIVVVTESGIARRPDLIGEVRAEVARCSHVGADPARAVVPGTFGPRALAVAGGSVLLHDVYTDPGDLPARTSFPSSEN
ncbi:ROK family transcriptional regulator [Actinomycetospora aeridis]|uniref:ROK family transcriptional regulator n=1 Tax=Actinomycetospora aeridis TaxID=3129231 RepID=A0ABU8NCX3_9PSEU